MDRARKAGFVGNNFVQNQVVKKLRADHVARLKKIRARKPGTSVTLDNNPPEVVNKTGENPRRKALKDLFGLITERENKAMLQRISTILTAQPESAVKDYYRMKKLVVTKSDTNAYERYMRNKRTKNFFENIKKQQPYYKKEDWERHYKEHVKNMRFMREVNYKRPPDFVDPFAKKEEPSPDDKNDRLKSVRFSYSKSQTHPNQTRDGSISKRTPSHSAAHVNRVRRVKHSKSEVLNGSDASLNLGHRSGSDGEDSIYSKQDPAQEEDGSESRGSTNGRGMDTFTAADKIGDDEVIDLASIEREIRISEEMSLRPNGVSLDTLAMVGHLDGPSGEQKLTVYSAQATIDCFMINREYIVLSAYVDEQEVQFEAEAEITLEELAVLRGSDLNLSEKSGQFEPANIDIQCDSTRNVLNQQGSKAQTLAYDLNTLRAVASEMVQHVELRVELDSGPRLILNLVSEDDQLGILSEVDGLESIPGPTDVASSHTTMASLLSEEELADMFLEDPNKPLLSKGIRLPVTFSVKPSASIGNITALIEAAKFSKKLEYVYGLLTVFGTGDDQMAVKVLVMTSTVTQFKRGLRPAVVKDSNLYFCTSLPSVIHADPELMATFAANLAQNVRIHHDGKTGKNVLTVDEQS